MDLKALRQSFNLAAAVLLILPHSTGFALAETMPANLGLWGNSGLMSVPNTSILPTYDYATALRYFPLNTGLSGTALLSPIPDLEVGLVFGAPPANGFSALAASAKYRILNEANGHPISMAVGVSMLGQGDSSNYVPASNGYLMLSRSFDWQNQRLFDLNAGFMGSLLGGARFVAGLDIPIMNTGRIEIEYLGAMNQQNHLTNIGFGYSPLPNLNIEASLMQRTTGSFWDRDFILGLSWQGNWGEWFQLAQPSPSPTPTAQPSVAPTPIATVIPTPEPSIRPPAQEKGSVKIRAIDREKITALGTARVILKQPSTGLYFEALTDLSGEAHFERIPIGQYEVLMDKLGWGSEVRLLSVQTDLETFLEVPLTGQGGAIYGQIVEAGQNSTEPLDDIDLEIFDSQNILIRRMNLNSSYYRLEKLPPGTYTLVIKQIGQERLRLNVQVKPNAESQYDLTLPPNPNATPKPSPTPVPTAVPSSSTAPSGQPSSTPMPSTSPSAQPSAKPSAQPTVKPSVQPSSAPSPKPSSSPSANPTPTPTLTPPPLPSSSPTQAPPSASPTPLPTTPPGPVQAQIQGTVKDKQGKALAGVRLELKSNDLTVITLSNAQGKYIFRDIPQGVFRLTISKTGLKQRAYQISIVRTETLTHDFVMEPNG